ncbi:hypothetical protein R1sor_012775 [Riccia sorocarpa]|uniref:Reverse transcriptase domain-containing protein n=1 Tax=Riccia sorocarpa TaxID=122646 RepID=A0ABD3I836_9MARC
MQTLESPRNSRHTEKILPAVHSDAIAGTEVRMLDADEYLKKRAAAETSQTDKVSPSTKPKKKKNKPKGQSGAVAQEEIDQASSQEDQHKHPGDNTQVNLTSLLDKSSAAGHDSLEQRRKQGCPIAPMLFAISTQPLMAMLREEEKLGTIQGVAVPRGRPFLHQFFADDSGKNITASQAVFRKVQWVVHRFESISGALLNLSKSMIVPLAMQEVPTCIAKVVKDQGGLEIIPFRLQSRTLKMRHISRILSGKDVEWAAAVKFFLKENISRGTSYRKRRYWSAAEAMLLHPFMRTHYSKTTDMLMDSWRNAVKLMVFTGPTYFIPSTLEIDPIWQWTRIFFQTESYHPIKILLENS